MIMCHELSHNPGEKGSRSASVPLLWATMGSLPELDGKAHGAARRTKNHSKVSVATVMTQKSSIFCQKSPVFSHFSPFDGKAHGAARCTKNHLKVSVAMVSTPPAPNKFLEPSGCRTCRLYTYACINLSTVYICMHKPVD